MSRHCRRYLFSIAFCAICFSHMTPTSACEDESIAPSLHGADQSFPMLIVQINNIDPGSVFVAETTIAAYSGRRSRWAERTVRQFMALPGNLTVDLPRRRGFAYLWNPTTAELPQLAEFWELLAGEIIDPNMLSAVENRQLGDGEVEAVVHEPDRWSLNYYSLIPRGKNWVREEPAVYSHHFAKNEQSLWKSTSPAVLKAALPPLIPTGTVNASLDLWLETNHLPDLLLDEWKTALRKVFATGLQKRDGESPAAYRLRHWRESMLQGLLETLTYEHAKLNGHFEIDHQSVTRGHVGLASENSQLLKAISRMAVRKNRLSSITVCEPWFHAWFGIRLSEKMRSQLKLLSDELERDPEFSKMKSTPLLNCLCSCEEFQLTFAGITGPDGTPGFAVGWYAENGAAALQPWAEMQARTLDHVIRFCGKSADITSTCDNSTLWVVAMQNSAGDVASTLLHSSQSLSSIPTQSIASFSINTSRLPAFDNALAISNDSPNTLPSETRAALLRILSVLRNVQTMVNSDSMGGANFSCELESNLNHLKVVLQSGNTATIGLAAAFTAELEAIRDQRRRSPVTE